ncbi:hypothetical protein BJ508DRAFT_417631 [Ascobolus immersus RN42]|uniref:Uncharacterized protein n=1 Tax=Ascobolus immersus RN42 TaxID=1160509 RepID=A0A3N4HWI5_ASCIM|nr:hypothetical protein BJ508DRAFT_417631 [Ascobolus immersus RN42]
MLSGKVTTITTLDCFDCFLIESRSLHNNCRHPTLSGRILSIIVANLIVPILIITSAPSFPGKRPLLPPTLYP